MSYNLPFYDTGLLGDGGGGDVDWWHTYMRHELERAHEFYSSQILDNFSEIKEALTIAVSMLRIASDWHAPTHYDIELPESWNDVKDEDSDEPDWAAIYLVCPKIEKLLKC